MTMAIVGAKSGSYDVLIYQVIYAGHLSALFAKLALLQETTTDKTILCVY